MLFEAFSLEIFVFVAQTFLLEEVGVSLPLNNNDYNNCKMDNNSNQLELARGVIIQLCDNFWGFTIYFHFTMEWKQNLQIFCFQFRSFLLHCQK